LMMRTIYLSTLNWADKEFFLIFLYIASLEQTWQNPSNINSRVGLRALISPTRSNINSRVGFELLSEIQFYGQANQHFETKCLINRNNMTHDVLRMMILRQSKRKRRALFRRRKFDVLIESI
jgi:hypothetical protein